jgi:hypothetical protein
VRKNGLVFELREHSLPPFVLYLSRRRRGAHLSFVDILQTSHEGQLERIFARYEQEMLARTRKAVLESRKAAKEMHSRNPVTRWFLQGKLHLANRLLPWFQKD